MNNQTNNAADMWEGVPVTSCYTRADALRDGVLIDVTEQARPAGFAAPLAVAVTAGLWADFVAVPGGKEGEQDEAGRLWDVLFLAIHAARKARDADRAEFSVLVVTSYGKRRLNARLHIGPGDNSEPVVTIMKQGED